MAEEITLSDYESRLARLCSGGDRRPLPRAQRDRWIILRAAVEVVEVDETLDEDTVSERLYKWINKVGRALDIDFAALRRYLVDEGFLDRTPDGTIFQRSRRHENNVTFDPAINRTKATTIIRRARRKATARRKQFTDKATLPPP